MKSHLLLKANISMKNNYEDFTLSQQFYHCNFLIALLYELTKIMFIKLLITVTVFQIILFQGFTFCLILSKSPFNTTVPFIRVDIILHFGSKLMYFLQYGNIYNN